MEYSTLRGKAFRDFKSNHKNLIVCLTESFKAEQIELIKTYVKNEIVNKFEELTLVRDESIGVEIGETITCNRELSGLEDNIVRRTETEIYYICYISENDFFIDYVTDNYSDIAKIERYIKDKKFEEMSTMTKAAIPLTPNQVKEYNSFKETYASIKQDADMEQLADRLNVSVDKLNLEKRCETYICKLVDKYVASDADVARKQGALNLGNEFIDLYMKLTHNGKVNKGAFTNLVKCNRKEVYYADAHNGERLATVLEVRQQRIGVFSRAKEVLTEEDSKCLYIFCWAIFGEAYYLKYAGIKPNKDELTNFELNMKGIIDAIRMMSKDSFENEKLPKVLKEARIVYPEDAEDELQERDMKELAKFFKNAIKENNSDFNKTAKAIVDSCVKYKKVPSEKQYRLVLKAYKHILSTAGSGENFYSPDLLQKIVDIEGSGELKKRKYKYMKDICTSVKKYGRASQKQHDIIANFHDSLTALRQAEEEKLFTDVDEIGFEEEETKVTYTNDISLNTGIKSIGDISDLLGGGEFE